MGEIYEMGPRGLVRVDVPANSVKNNLQPGAVLHWGGNMGFPAEDFAVITRQAFTHGWGGAPEIMYDCLGLRNYQAHRVEGMHIKAETDPSVWHGQHFFLTDRVLSGDEVLDLIECNRVKLLADAATQDHAVNKFRADSERLRAAKEWSHLTQTKAGEYSGHVLAAKNIKRELAKLWPGVSFSVRSKSYSGGNSIDVSWTDGPTSKDVERRVTGKYSGGDFDGMTDSYTHTSTPWTEIFGSGKYIFESRSYSSATEDAARRDIARELRLPDFGHATATPEDWRPRLGWDLGQAARHCLQHMDLSAGYVTPENILMADQ